MCYWQVFPSYYHKLNKTKSLCKSLGKLLEFQTKVLIIISIISISLLFADSISTDIALERGLAEGNPNSRIILETYGVLGLYLVSLFFSVLVVLLVIAYIGFSRSIGWMGKKCSCATRTIKVYRWLIFLIFFILLLILTLQRALTVANNILLILQYT